MMVLFTPSFPGAGFAIENVGRPARVSGLGILPRIASSAGWKYFINEWILHNVYMGMAPGLCNLVFFFFFF